MAVKPHRRSKGPSIKNFLLVVAILLGGGWCVFFVISHQGIKTKTNATMTGQERKFFRGLTIHFEEYKETFQQYPRGFQELIDLEWIRDIPLDTHSRQITYKPGDDGKSYELRSAGKDGLLGNDDDSCLRSVTNNKMNLYFYTCVNDKK